MAQHLQRELEKLKKRILSLGAMVEERVRKAVKSLETNDLYDAERIIKEDYEIDEAEVEIEEECLKVLALYQPVAVDLRFLVAIIKINNDLERIADEAVNIARRIKSVIKKENSPDFSVSYNKMAEKAESMLKQSLDALVNLDADLAFKVCITDDEVDEMNREVYRQVRAKLKQNPDHVEYIINYYLISRHLERIGDHATNVAEEVIYLIEGEIVRHSNF